MSEQTAPGHTWFCNACAFQTRDLERGLQHCLEARNLAKMASHPFGHILYERENMDRKPVRRIVDWEGAVQVQGNPGSWYGPEKPKAKRRR